MARKRGGKGGSKAKAKATAKGSAGKEPEEFEDVDETPEEEGGDEEFEPIEDRKEEEFEPVEDKKEEEFEPVEEMEEEFEPIEEGPPVEIKTSGMKVRGGEDADYEPTLEEVLAYATGKTKRPSDAPPPHAPKASRRASKGAKGKSSAKVDEDALSDIFDEKGK